MATLFINSVILCIIMVLGGSQLVTFAERLKQLRKENGVTMEKLAEEIGTTKSTISRYENNKREPKKHFI